jgi:hypothetical protein
MGKRAMLRFPKERMVKMALVNLSFIILMVRLKNGLLCLKLEFLGLVFNFRMILVVPLGPSLNQVSQGLSQESQSVTSLTLTITMEIEFWYLWLLIVT